MTKIWNLGILLVALGLTVAGPNCLAADNAGSTPPESKLVIDDHHRLPATLFSDRPAGARIDTVVVHFISAIEIDAKKAYDLDTILALFKPDAAKHRAATSAHYLIERSGKVLLLVPEDKRAWHAGPSKMPPPDNREAVNDFSIGIELVMTAKDHPTDEQYEVLAHLILDLKSRYAGLKEDNIVGHDTVRANWNLAHPEKPAFIKTDPGPLFHWSRLMCRLSELRF